MNSPMQPDYRRRLEAAEARVAHLENLIGGLKEAHTVTARRAAAAEAERDRLRDYLIGLRQHIRDCRGNHWHNRKADEIDALLSPPTADTEEQG